LNIIYELGNENARSSSVAVLVNSKEKIMVRQIGEPLLGGLELEQVHQMLLINSKEMKIEDQV